MAPNRIAPDAGHRDEDPQTPSDLASGDGSRPEAAEPGPEPSGLSPDEQLAGHVRDTIPSLFMFASMHQAAGSIPERSFRIYRDRLLADCGKPDDPIECMLIEQLALAHLNLGLLMCRSANAGQVQATSVYAGAAARLMGEFRRSSLALQAYRAASKQLAHDPTKDFVVPALPVAPAPEPVGKNDADGELNEPMEETDAGDDIIPYARPERPGGRKPRGDEAPPDHARAKGAGTRRGAAEPAVGARHGAADG